MIHQYRGFTIIELLAVIAVIGILLSMVTLGWSKYITATTDNAREADTRQWASTFDLYKSRFLAYPAPASPTGASPTVALCLGAVNSFLTATAQANGNRCGAVTASATAYAEASNNLTDEIKRIGRVHVNAHENNKNIIIDNKFVGPIVYAKRLTAVPTSGAVVNVEMYFINFFKGGCPKEFSAPDLSGGVLSGLASELSDTSMCALEKTYTYTAP